MRLSEIRGERVFDVIADIIEPACNIAEDPNASKLFTRDDKPEGMEATEWVLKKVKESVPSLMKSHRDDLMAIICAIKGVEREEYVDSLTMSTLLQDVYELLTDGDLLAFLS